MRRTGKILANDENGFISERMYAGLLTSRANTFETEFSGLLSSRRNDEIFTAREKGVEASQQFSKGNTSQRIHHEFNVTLGKGFAGSTTNRMTNLKDELTNEKNSHEFNEDSLVNQVGKDGKTQENKNRNKKLLSNITNYESKKNDDIEEENSTEIDNKKYNTLLLKSKSPNISEKTSKKPDKAQKENPIILLKPRDSGFPGILDYCKEVEIKKEDTINKDYSNTSKFPDYQDTKNKEIITSENGDKLKSLKDYKPTKIEDKCISKDKIIEELKKYNEEIILALKNSEKNLSTTLAEKDKIIHQLTSEKIKLSEKILDFEKNSLGIKKELQALNENVKQKNDIITDLKQQNYKLKIEVEKNANISDGEESLLKKLKILEEENFKSKMHLENHDQQLKYEYQEKMRKLQHNLEMANLEIEYLKSQNQEITNRSQTTSEVSSVSNDTKCKKMEKTSKNDRKKDLLGNISQEFNFAIEQDDEKIKDLQEYKKQTHKFLTRLNQLVIELSPPNHFKSDPTLKDVWKWIQNLLKEYMNLKKKNSLKTDETNEINNQLKSILKINSSSEILSVIKSLLISEEKNKMLLSKFKSLLDHTKVCEFNEYEKRLEKKNYDNS